MGNNLPDDTWPGDPRAPWNQPEPQKELLMLDVSVGMDIEVTENADEDEIYKAIRKALDNGDYVQVLNFEVGAVEPVQ